MNNELIPEIQLELSEYNQFLKSIDIPPELKKAIYNPDIVKVNYMIDNLSEYPSKIIKDTLEKFKGFLISQGNNKHAIKINVLISRIGG